MIVVYNYHSCLLCYYLFLTKQAELIYFTASSDYHCTFLVTQFCLTLCDPMNCSPPGSSVYGDSPGKNTGVGCHALLQGLFPNQGLDPSLPHCRWILYHLSHQESPRKQHFFFFKLDHGFFVFTKIIQSFSTSLRVKTRKSEFSQCFPRLCPIW